MKKITYSNVLTTKGLRRLPLTEAGEGVVSKHQLAIAYFIRTGDASLLQSLNGVRLSDGVNIYAIETRPERVDCPATRKILQSVDKDLSRLQSSLERILESGR